MGYRRGPESALDCSQSHFVHLVGRGRSVGLSWGRVVPDPVHLNAKADQCSTTVVNGGQRVVRYRGEEYLMVGLYFARGANGQRELFYILRLPGGNGTGPPSRS